MGNVINLTDIKVATLKPPAVGQNEIGDGKVPGLRIRVSASGSKSFIVRKRGGEKIKVITLGRYGPRLGLTEARKRARNILSDIEAGKNITSVQRGALTVENLWIAYEKTKSNHRSLPETRR